MKWEFNDIKEQGRRWLRKTMEACRYDSSLYTEALEAEIIRLMKNPREVLSEHPGCVYCMEAGTPVQDGEVCSECGDRNPTEAERKSWQRPEERTNNAAPQAAILSPGSSVGAPAVAAPDPGTEKILRTLLDRAYKMMLMSGYKVAVVDSDNNDPIVAWMSDARHVLYGSGRVPHPVLDLQSTASSPQKE